MIEFTYRQNGNDTESFWIGVADEIRCPRCAFCRRSFWSCRVWGAILAQINAEKAKVAPDEKAAIALAEKASLPLIGGEGKLAIARPFRATGHGDIWL